ncbi:MAG: hypothetical protein K2O29_00025 [Ruminococcus sp.]|nr:hypothetical protein [Ruminococcus sp.]MDE7136835.1 hypothetical protein [Ruminococcus sp.]
MKKLNFIFIVLFDIISVLIAYGNFLEIKGIISYIIFFIPLVLNIILIRKYEKIFPQLLLSFMIFVYLLTGVVFLIREDSRKVVSQNKNDKYIYVTYEINPGAMGHLSYEDRVYYSLIDTDLLTVCIVKESEHYRYKG